MFASVVFINLEIEEKEILRKVIKYYCFDWLLKAKELYCRRHEADAIMTAWFVVLCQRVSIYDKCYDSTKSGNHL